MDELKTRNHEYHGVRRLLAKDCISQEYHRWGRDKRSIAKNDATSISPLHEVISRNLYRLGYHNRCIHSPSLPRFQFRSKILFTFFVPATSFLGLHLPPPRRALSVDPHLSPILLCHTNLPHHSFLPHDLRLCTT